MNTFGSERTAGPESGQPPAAGDARSDGRGSARQLRGGLGPSRRCSRSCPTSVADPAADRIQFREQVAVNTVRTISRVADVAMRATS